MDIRREGTVQVKTRLSDGKVLVTEGSLLIDYSHGKSTVDEISYDNTINDIHNRSKMFSFCP